MSLLPEKSKRLRRDNLTSWFVLALIVCSVKAAEQQYQELRLPPTGKTGFVLLPPQANGIWFTNTLPEERYLTNQILLNGSGVAAGDVDGDGWCDLYFCRLGGPNVLYHNEGNGRFRDITEAAGVSCLNLDSTGAAFADIDGDGDLDLIVNTLGGGAHVFFNDGHSHFTESPKNAGMNARRGGTSIALADVDGDGDLDLYVVNYRTVTIRDQPSTRLTIGITNGQRRVKAIDGRPVTDSEEADRFKVHFRAGEGRARVTYEEQGEPDVLYLNDGHGIFTPVSFTGGAFEDEQNHPLSQPPLDWGLSAMFRDLNGDGAPDLYVCNDFASPDRLWINDGQGRFRAAAPLAIRHTSLSSMGVDMGDLNRDGFDEIMVVEMLSRDPVRRLTQRNEVMTENPSKDALGYRPQHSQNILQLNRGDGTFAEIAQFSGLESSEWSWMPIFLDADLDGYEDFLIVNGYERDTMNVDAHREIDRLKKEQRRSAIEQLRLRRLLPRLDTANLAFHNQGNLKFVEKGAEWGFDARTISQGTALADIDNDGDLDVIVNNMNSGAGIYRNETTAPRVAARLKGLPPNTRGIGAKIRFLGGPAPQSQEMICGGRYLSCDDTMRVFTCGKATNGLSIEVTWRSRKRSFVTNALPNCLYEIDEAGAEEVQSPKSKVQSRESRVDGGETRRAQFLAAESPPFFNDVSEWIEHKHQDEPFDDFARQPMLPNRLSQLGPGAAWFDGDGDGWEDLIIASGRSGSLAVYRNKQGSGFQRLAETATSRAAVRDQTTVLGWRPARGPARLLVGCANYEDGLTNSSAVVLLDWATRGPAGTLPDFDASVGPLAMADLDGDGHLDLFLGGRVIAGHYAEPASSMIFRGGPDGQLALDVENTARLRRLGLVSGAVFSDLDGDGAPDLILACEWGPLRVFQDEKSRLVEVTHALGFDRYPGWWNGVTTGDFDGDGRMDIAASNWGQNTKCERYRKQALHLFVGDVDDNDTVEIIEAHGLSSAHRWSPLQPFHVFQAAVPLIADRVGSCTAYAQSGLEEIYGERLNRLTHLQASWLESTVFLNRGNHFDPRVLPLEAQIAPAFAVGVGDLDGDGLEDLFLSQNFFATREETTRYDAGRGLWLRGDGRGNFRAVPGQESGITVYGEQRGAALSDFDGDGRVDLVVAQNAAETKLYKTGKVEPVR